MYFQASQAGRTFTIHVCIAVYIILHMCKTISQTYRHTCVDKEALEAELSCQALPLPPRSQSHGEDVEG